MAPDANLAEQLELARRLYAQFEASPDDDPRVDAHDAARLCELVEALDAWLHRAGSLPRRWHQPQP
jgi:hypothetical protein